MILTQFPAQCPGEFEKILATLATHLYAPTSQQIGDLVQTGAFQGLQGLPGMGGMAGPSMGDMGASTSVDGNDPAAALTDFIAPEDAPKKDANGTLIEDSGVIGADGKRQGQLAPPPDFTFPIIFFSITAVIMVAYFTYSCCFAKEEKRAKGDSYM